MSHDSYGRPPAEVPLLVKRGSTNPHYWRLRGGTVDARLSLDFSGGDYFILTASYRGALLFPRKSTAEADSGLELVPYTEVDPDSDADENDFDTVVWTPTAAETRLVKPGRSGVKYELEHRYSPAGQDVIIHGDMIGVAGYNND